MKIAIITLNGHNNYGNRLQNYALQEFLLRYTNNVDTIWYDKNNYLPEVNTWDFFWFIKYSLNWKNTRQLQKDYGKNCIREYRIKKFSDKYINIRYDYKIKDDLNLKYDFFIVGSDQVWYPNLWNYRAKFLLFADEYKRISYAASFGLEYISKIRGFLINRFIKKGLKGIKYISVRENAGAQIVESIINKKVPVLLDPTMLIDKEKWKKISKKPDWYINEKYILTYFLGNKIDFIEKYAIKKNLKVINLMDKNDIDVYTTSVEEFVYLIDNAEIVFTDSFHGTVFSILLNTPFYVVKREEKGGKNMFSRLDTLLNIFNFKNRYIDRVENKNTFIDINMDFSDVERILDVKIKETKEFFDNIFKNYNNDRTGFENI